MINSFRFIADFKQKDRKSALRKSAVAIGKVMDTAGIRDRKIEKEKIILQGLNKSGLAAVIIIEESGKGMIDWLKGKNRKMDFEEKIIGCLDSIYNAAFRMTQNREDAEDLVQETSLRAYRFFCKFRKGTNFKAWVITILRNIYINEYRKKIKEPQKVAFEEIEDTLSSVQARSSRERVFSEVIKASINGLSEELRSTVTLFYNEEFSYKEIAGVMDVPVGTVMSRLYTARNLLKKRLSEAMLDKSK